MTAGLLGCIVTPAQGNRVPNGAVVAADNGRFGRGWPGRDRYLAWLARLSPLAGRLAFAVAPDVPFDMAATLAYSAPYLDLIPDLGLRVALQAARAVTAEARARGKHVHMGRVNSLRRARYAAATGCHSADGTYLTFGPDHNLPALLAWLRDINGQLPLFPPEAAA